MRVLLVAIVAWHAAALTVIESALHTLHRPPPSQPNHVETPRRLDAAVAAVQSVDQGRIAWARAQDSERTTVDGAVDALKRVHDVDHLREVMAMSRSGGGGFDSDTYVAPGSWEASLDGTRAWVDALAGAADGAGPCLALARPAGHHATRSAAMGFGLVNYAAAAAAAALAGGAKTVAILDWDVHYGNGVAGIFADEPRVRYCSVHEAAGFPKTPGQDGAAASPSVLHVPLPRGFGGAAFLGALEDVALPFLLREPRPDALLVCAGFDALEADPLGTATLAPADFGAATRAIAAAFPPSRTALGLEGGYALGPDDGMPAALRETCAALLGDAP